jgi:hypothetical protein
MITGCTTHLQKVLLHSPLSYQGGYLNFGAWFMEKKKVLFEQEKIKSRTRKQFLEK